MKDKKNNATECCKRIYYTVSSTLVSNKTNNSRNNWKIDVCMYMLKSPILVFYIKYLFILCTQYILNRIPTL